MQTFKDRASLTSVLKLLQGTVVYRNCCHRDLARKLQNRN